MSLVLVLDSEKYLKRYFQGLFTHSIRERKIVKELTNIERTFENRNLRIRSQCYVEIYYTIVFVVFLTRSTIILP